MFGIKLPFVIMRRSTIEKLDEDFSRSEKLLDQQTQKLYESKQEIDDLSKVVARWQDVAAQRVSKETLKAKALVANGYMEDLRGFWRMKNEKGFSKKGPKAIKDNKDQIERSLGKVQSVLDEIKNLSM